LHRIFELKDNGSGTELYEYYRNKFHPDDLQKLKDQEIEALGNRLYSLRIKHEKNKIY